MQEQITAVGHEHVQATHQSTLEITTDEFLTPAGDCIVAIEADRSPATFSSAFVDACRHTDARILLDISVKETTVTIEGRGDPGLTFDSDRSLVCRTSDYIDDRTVMLEADHAATDIPRSMVQELENGAELTATLRVD